MKMYQQFKSLIPLIHADGTLEIRPVSWEMSSCYFPAVDQYFHPQLASHYFVHKNFDIGDASYLETKSVDIKVFNTLWYWEENTLKDVLCAYFHWLYNLESEIEITNLEFEGVITLPIQSNRVSEVGVGFQYQLIHGEDYDPRCMVCSESAETIHTILDDWLADAVLVEEDWDEQDYFKIKNTRQIIILKKSNKPNVARLLEWFVENFEETIKLAAIDKIVFCEYGTTTRYECIIKYE